jgi:hypothetical protein
LLTGVAWVILVLLLKVVLLLLQSSV